MTYIPPTCEELGVTIEAVIRKMRRMIADETDQPIDSTPIPPRQEWPDHIKPFRDIKHLNHLNLGIGLPVGCLFSCMSSYTGWWEFRVILVVVHNDADN
jgi:hypothetical protein